MSLQAGLVWLKSLSVVVCTLVRYLLGEVRRDGNKAGSGRGRNWKKMKRLPVECVSHIISFTSPRDACRSSAVSSVFRRAVDSDIVWDKFLPHDYKRIISSSSSLNSMSKKDLYFYLCTHPIIIGDGNMVSNPNFILITLTLLV